MNLSLLGAKVRPDPYSSTGFAARLHAVACLDAAACLGVAACTTALVGFAVDRVLAPCTTALIGFAVDRVLAPCTTALVGVAVDRVLEPWSHAGDWTGWCNQEKDHAS